jgi:hypothetical protein
MLKADADGRISVSVRPVAIVAAAAGVLAESGLGLFAPALRLGRHC